MKYKPTRMAYEIYKAEKEKIAKRMESKGSAPFVEDVMNKDEFDASFNILQGELEASGATGYNSRSIAKELAKRESYVVSAAQADKLVEAADVLFASGELEGPIAKYEFMFGTERANQAWDKLDEVYHKMIEAGMTSEQSSKIISQVFFGSE